MAELTHGMNIEEVEGLGRFLQERAVALHAISTAIDQKVRATSWNGTDADRFRNQWWPSHRKRLTALDEDLKGFGQSALNNANEQRQASDAGGNTGPGGSQIGGQPGGPHLGTGDPALDKRLEDLLASAKDLEFIRSTYGLTQGELDEAVGLLKHGGVVGKKSLPILGILLGSADVGVNAYVHGWGDGRTMFAEVDAFVSTGLSIVVGPHGAMAWSLGTKLGEYASSGLDWVSEATTGDTYAGHVVNGALNRAAGGDFNSLPPDEQVRVASEVSQRYEGWSGFGNFIWDAAT